MGQKYVRYSSALEIKEQKPDNFNLPEISFIGYNNK